VGGSTTEFSLLSVPSLFSLRYLKEHNASNFSHQNIAPLQLVHPKFSLFFSTKTLSVEKYNGHNLPHPESSISVWPLLTSHLSHFSPSFQPSFDQRFGNSLDPIHGLFPWSFVARLQHAIGSFSPSLFLHYCTSTSSPEFLQWNPILLYSAQL